MKKNLILFLVFIPFFLSCKNNGEIAVEKPVRVRVQPVIREEVSFPVRTSGRLSVESEQKLSFRTGGIIKNIFVKEGEEVKKGQTLTTLNLSEINPQVNVAREAYEKAKRDFTRAENLYNDSVATLELFQNAKTALEVALSNLQIAEFNLKHSQIEAPANGRILKILFEENEMTSPGYPVILFGSLESMWVVKVNISDKDLVSVENGDSARIYLDPFAGTVFPGVVTGISSMADPYTGMYEVEIRLTDTKNKKMAAGFIAKAEIIPFTENLVALPVDAVLNSSGNSGYIYLVSDSFAVKNQISILHITGEKIYTADSLKPGTLVVTEGMAYLNGNTRIEADTTGSY